MSVKVNHPTIPGACKTVPDEVAGKWLENGWTPVVEKKPEPAKKTAPKPSPKK